MTTEKRVPRAASIVAQGRFVRHVMAFSNIGNRGRRNGTSPKLVKGDDDLLPIAVPHDRDGSFHPELIKKCQTRIDGMDDKIISLYAADLMMRKP